MPQPAPSFRWVHLEAGTVQELARDVDDRWVPFVTFVRSSQGGPWKAFPCAGITTVALVEDPAVAQVIADRHLWDWEQACAQWGREHPGEDLPHHLLEG